MREINPNVLQTVGADAITRQLSTDTSNCAIGATVDTAITLTFATVAGYHWCPGLVFASYDATPTAGGLHITNQAVTATYYAGNLTASGLASLNFDKVMLPVSTGMKVTIKATTGSTAKGTVNCYPYLVKG